MPSGICFLYEMEDWMKRSYCLLQKLRYPAYVNKVLHKILKKFKVYQIYATYRMLRKNDSNIFRHADSSTPPTRAGVLGKRSIKRFITPPQAPMTRSRAP